MARHRRHKSLSWKRKRRRRFIVDADGNVHVLFKQPTISAGSANDFEHWWSTLKEAFLDIHRMSSSHLTFEHLYRACYKIVLKKKGDVLYRRVREFETEWFTAHVIPKIKALITTNMLNVALSAGTSIHERREFGESFLRGIQEKWEDHNRAMCMEADILMYLDRGYTRDARLPDISTATIGLFRDRILQACLNESSQLIVLDILISVILDQIKMERNGDIIDRALIRRSVRMLEILHETDEEKEQEQLYYTTFEPKFLAASRQYYKAECQRLLREADAPAWLAYTQRRLVEESQRCDTTILEDTKDRILRVIEEELISAHLQDFLLLENNGLKWMVHNDKTGELSILYSLVLRVDTTLKPLIGLLQARVMDLGQHIQANLTNQAAAQRAPAVNQGDGDDDNVGEKPKAQQAGGPSALTTLAIKWVDDVLRLKTKFDNLWKECFDKNLLLNSAMSKSFSDFVQLFDRCSEYVSLFVDENLKRGIRGKTDAEIHQILEDAVTMILYLKDRDMFERYYQRHLARRLLHDKSESHDVEKQLISRMKQEMGNQFTAKFEGMFQDLDTSAGLSSNYREHISGLGDVGAEGKATDLSIHVLATNRWPAEIMGRSAKTIDDSQVQIGCIYPIEIKKLQESFTKFYHDRHNGRKLTWLPNTGGADIKCLLPPIPGKSTGPGSRERRFEINVSSYTMIVLLLFNELAADESLTFEEIQAKTNIPDVDLQRALAAISLAPKSRLLLKEPLAKEINRDDKFSINLGFVSKSAKIKAPIINSVSKVESETERKATEERNNLARSGVVDAAIVRIMKWVKYFCPAFLPFPSLPFPSPSLLELPHILSRFYI
jgi:cullin 3